MPDPAAAGLLTGVCPAGLAGCAGLAADAVFAGAVLSAAFSVLTADFGASGAVPSGAFLLSAGFLSAAASPAACWVLTADCVLASGFGSSALASGLTSVLASGFASAAGSVAVGSALTVSGLSVPSVLAGSAAFTGSAAFAAGLAAAGTAVSAAADASAPSALGLVTLRILGSLPVSATHTLRISSSSSVDLAFGTKTPIFSSAFNTSVLVFFNCFARASTVIFVTD